MESAFWEVVQHRVVVFDEVVEVVKGTDPGPQRTGTCRGRPGHTYKVVNVAS